MTEITEGQETRVAEFFRVQQQELFERTDRMFAVLMLLQWIAAIFAAVFISPRTWSGTMSETHVHVLAAIVLGGALALYPIFLVVTRPGQAVTRYVIAVAQTLTSALLIHLTGGRIETHFHVFGSLAFLAFYRDRNVLLSAAAVVVVDHLLRGFYWPESAYGVVSAPLWRSFEHAGWVVFEMTFLLIAIKKGRREMWDIANRQVRVEVTQEQTELQVMARTAELRRTEARTRAILETAADGIITIDHTGVIQTFNPAAEKIFGYSAEEVVGHNVSTLMPPPYAEAHDGYLRAYLATGDKNVIGVGREVTGKRKDGSTFPLDLSVSESTDGVFTGIVRDITERKSVDRMKTEFISTVSHELRTPLTSIRGSLGLLIGGLGGELNEKARSLIEIATNNSERLVRLVNDILDIEKIESGNMEFRLEPHDLFDVVAEAVAANEAFAGEHGVGIRLDPGEQGARVRIDKDRVVQVVTNLISNAAKFSPEGENVRVGLFRDGSNLRVEVADRGPGIPAEFRSRIFGKFAQADSSDVRQRGGTGLGLSISKAIVETHGGSIGFETEEGHGTTFHFVLPALSDQGSATAASPAPPADETGPRVLVCEDDPDIAHLLTLMLREAGTVVDVARCTEEVHELLAVHRYEAMTLDLKLAGESGLDLLRELRNNPATSTLPVVVVSGNAVEGRQQLEPDTLGVINWLSKPIDQEQLLDSICNAVRTRPEVVDGDAKPRVLHVEDNEDLASIVAQTLSPVAEVVQARNLAEARQLLSYRGFDVVLLDLELPDGSGLDLVPLLGHGAVSVPAVIFSANDPTAEIGERVAASLVKCRTTNDELIETITSVVRGCGAARS